MRGGCDVDKIVRFTTHPAIWGRLGPGLCANRCILWLSCDRPPVWWGLLVPLVISCSVYRDLRISGSPIGKVSGHLSQLHDLALDVTVGPLVGSCIEWVPTSMAALFVCISHPDVMASLLCMCQNCLPSMIYYELTLVQSVFKMVIA